MPYTTNNDNNYEREPRSPIEAMMRGRLMEPVAGLELLKRVMPAEAPIVPMSEEVRLYEEQVNSLIEDRSKSENELRLEQIRAQVNQEAH